MDIQDIKKIPRAKRILLVQEIWDSLEHKEDLELSDEVKAELDHRLARHESGEATYFSLEEVREKLAKVRK